MFASILLLSLPPYRLLLVDLIDSHLRLGCCCCSAVHLPKRQVPLNKNIIEFSFDRLLLISIGRSIYNGKFYATATWAAACCSCSLVVSKLLVNVLTGLLTLTEAEGRLQTLEVQRDR